MKIPFNLHEEYRKYVEQNSSDPYSKAVVDAGEAVMNLLDEGKTPEEAGKGLNGKDLTGFMAGSAISGVCYFHERGEEMKEWWNRNQSGQPDENGVNNPAIIEI